MNSIVAAKARVQKRHIRFSLEHDHDLGYKGICLFCSFAVLSSLKEKFEPNTRVPLYVPRVLQARPTGTGR